MSFFEKLKFWGQEDQPDEWMKDLDADMPLGGGPPTGLPSSTSVSGMGSLIPAPTPGGFAAEQITPAQSPYQIVSPQPLYQQVQPPLNKDMEILSLKLDAIKNILDTVNMRLERIEAHARAEDRFAQRESKF